MGDKVRTIISASYSKNLKKFASTTKEVESRKEKIKRYLESSIIDLRRKAVELADSKYSLFSDNKEAVEKYRDKVKTFFTQIMIAKKLVKDTSQAGVLDKMTALKYASTLNELEHRALRLFEIDAIRDRADTDFNTYSKYLKYRFGNVDVTIKRLKEQLLNEKDPHKRKELDAKINELEKYQSNADKVLNKYSDSFFNNYTKMILNAKNEVDRIYSRARKESNQLYKQMSKREDFEEKLRKAGLLHRVIGEQKSDR